MIKRSHGYKDSLIYLDVEAYLKDLRKNLKSAMRDIKDDLVSNLRSTVLSLPFKDNPVRIGGTIGPDGSIVGGYLTSDLERQNAVVNSIEGHMSFIEKDVLEVVVTALEKDFEDSHIGLYYEHGTGTEWDGTMTPVSTNPSPNKYRTSKSVVSRSRFINYAGIGRGRWVDLGGNVRVTASGEAGIRNDKFIKYIGDDIKAYHWFSNAFSKRRDKYMQMIREAVKNVPLNKYLILKSEFILGRD